MPLKKTDIIGEALSLLHQSGIEGVTLRRLAGRLGVQAPALYWHFKNKAVLVNEMAEAILQSEFAEIQPMAAGERWQGWLVHTLNRLRRAMLSHTDGGRVVAGAHMSIKMANLTETTIGTLAHAGVSLHESRLIVLTAIHFTFGYVIEEQSPPAKEDFESFDLESFKQQHPLTITAIQEYFAAGRTVDDLYNDGLRLIVRN